MDIVVVDDDDDDSQVKIDERMTEFLPVYESEVLKR